MKRTTTLYHLLAESPPPIVEPARTMKTQTRETTDEGRLTLLTLLGRA